MLIRENTAKNIGAYFHEEDGAMELRIPVTSRRAAIVKKIIHHARGKSGILAGELSIPALSMLDEIPAGASEHVAQFAMDHGGNYRQILELLQRFKGEGWIDDYWRQKILGEMRARLAIDDFESEDMEWVRAVFKAHGGVESPDKEPKVAA